MHGYPRSTFARITLLALLLGLAMAAPAGVAAQDDDTDDAPFAEITFAPDEDAGPDDANAVPPDCDDGGWANLKTRDGTGFASEDHCDDHVAEHGEESVFAVGAGEDEYVAVTMTEPIGDDQYCTVTGTLFNGQNGQHINAVVTTSNNRQFRWGFDPSRGDTTYSGSIPYGQYLESGTAELVDELGDPTGETLMVHMPNVACF